MGKPKPDLKKRDPNEIPLNIHMNEAEYAEAKCKRFDILIENETNPATIERYRQLKGEFMKSIPKRKIRKLKDKKHEELEKTERALGEREMDDKVLRKHEARLREKELTELKAKRQAILREMMEIDRVMGDVKQEEEGMECPVCGQVLNDPEHPSHVNSTRHQAALLEQQQLKKESSEDGD